MKLDKSKLTKKLTYLEGDDTCLSDDIKNIAADFKKQLSNRFYSITEELIDLRIKGEKFFVSKKIDGHFQTVFYLEDELFICGRNGNVKAELEFLDDLKKALKSKKVKSFVAAGELCLKKERCRVYDVSSALADAEKLKQLDILFFELIELDGVSFRNVSYEENFNKLSEIVGKNVIETKIVSSPKEVKDIYRTWVSDEKNEGIVVRNDAGGICKIKPKLHFDVVVIGYAEGINEKKNKVKSLLFAFRSDEFYQIGGKVGNIPDAERENLFKQLSKLNTASNYIESDNEGIAFHFIKPEIVVEVSCNDIITESTYGSPLMNNVLTYEDNAYKLKQSKYGAKFINLVFEGIRTDKSNTPADVNTKQFESIVEIETKTKAAAELPKSSIIFREVYKKEQKDKIMVQKFIILKTNKEKINPAYPAYVMHYTDFSSGRAEPLKKEIRVSSSEKQIHEILDSYLKENIKKGWVVC